MKKQVSSKYRSNKRGSVVAELPLVLWVFFMVIALPLLNLGAAFIRITFLYAGVHLASISAARANTFLLPIDGKPSATNEAIAKLNQMKGAFSGVEVRNVRTEILITNVDTLAASTSALPLSKPADASVNTYQIVVTAQCEGQPLLPLPTPMPIAGVSAPLTFNLSARQYCENPQGLTL
ncbi:MAG TPA: hypothetical protein PLC15_15045 [Candidatus Obscuribacter sp.]|nr:hypothetical protein [Candidatus Obscuribacter sp.]HMY55186.1 hypothetical protein [Candidatus Obscuribacter sp.]HNB16698.1 hypothetical protein [Candidatus Obscuribacter sp.]HND05733.1 hypothetical protein [Candidatus Obscuribacter sp.]HND67956.1 hypothetical protein [Candidatus Obscuribacter sp.]